MSDSDHRNRDRRFSFSLCFLSDFEGDTARMLMEFDRGLYQSNNSDDLKASNVLELFKSGQPS